MVLFLNVEFQQRNQTKIGREDHILLLEITKIMTICSFSHDLACSTAYRPQYELVGSLPIVSTLHTPLKFVLQQSMTSSRHNINEGK